jgi:hypothetical protein
MGWRCLIHPEIIFGVFETLSFPSSRMENTNIRTHLITRVDIETQANYLKSTRSIK